MWKIKPSQSSRKPQDLGTVGFSNMTVKMEVGGMLRIRGLPPPPQVSRERGLLDQEPTGRRTIVKAHLQLWRINQQHSVTARLGESQAHDPRSSSDFLSVHCTHTPMTPSAPSLQCRERQNQAF